MARAPSNEADSREGGRWAVFGIALAAMVAMVGLLFTLLSANEPTHRDEASARAVEAASGSGPAAPSKSETDGADLTNAAEVKEARARSRAKADQIRKRLAVVSEGARLAREPAPAPKAGEKLPGFDAAAPPAPSQLKDRIGLGDATKQALHRDFMPLVSECIDMAAERGVEMTGMLAINVGMVGDEDLGAVVDAISFGRADQGRDVEMLECLRETALSLTLPPPEQGGRADMMFTIPLDE